MASAAVVAGTGASPAAAPSPAPSPVPGDLLLRPVSLVSVVVLALNDHWLKPRLGPDPRLGAVTGKLSDLAGLVFFPLVLVSLVELARWLVRGRDGEPWAATRREVAVAVAGTGAVFAAVQVLPLAAAAYAGSLAVLRWLPAGLVAVVTAAPLPALPRIHHVMDVTDCLGLPALWWGYRAGLRGREPRPGEPVAQRPAPSPTGSARSMQP